MRPPRSRSPRTSAREADAAGVTLIEVLIYSVLMLLVVGTGLDTLQSVTRAQAVQVDRSESLASMRLALDRMTKELRQATAVTSSVSDASAIEVTTYVRGVPHRVRYQASGAVLTRSVDDGTAVPLLRNLASTDLFATTTGTTSTDVQWIRITMRVNSTRGAHTELVLDSEVNLRNGGRDGTGS